MINMGRQNAVSLCTTLKIELALCVYSLLNLIASI